MALSALLLSELRPPDRSLSGPLCLHPAAVADSEETGEVECPLEQVQECECVARVWPGTGFAATCCGAAPHAASLAAADPSYTAAWTARCCAHGNVLGESAVTAREKDRN